MMTTFAIIPLDDNIETLRKELDNHKAVYRDYGPRAFFVKHGGTAKELAERVGFSQQHGARAGVIVEVVNYYGFANQDLWLWLDRS